MRSSADRDVAPGPVPAALATARLSPTGRVVRLAAAAVIAVVTLAGTLYGQDSDFPFGPFRMYATRDDPNGIVRIVAVQTVGVDGRVRDVTTVSGAPRRAELEGRMSTFRSDCTQFAPLVARYHPSSDVATVRLVERDYPLRGGRRKSHHDDVVCSFAWTPR